MKKIKKLISLALSFVMVFAMSMTAFAEEPSQTKKYSITINEAADGHTYEAYQIFKGDLYEKDGQKTLSNITWGGGVNTTKEGFNTAVAVTKSDETIDGSDPVKLAEALVGTDVAQWAQAVSGYLTNPAGSTNVYNTKEGKYVISNLEAGYYLVKDRDGSLSGNDTYTTFILEVVADAVAQPKNPGVPTPDKGVKDKNDSTGEADETYKKTADHDIGDKVEYELKATLPATVEKYDTYKLVFNDLLSKGLTYDEGSAKVYLSNAPERKKMISPADYKLTLTPQANDENLLKIEFADVKTTGAINNSVITVEYTATLNEEANLGETGNMNTLTLEYSNNPNSTGNGENEPTGTTPPETAIVFTFEPVVNKIDSNKQPLAGAAFELHKWVKNEDNEEGTWVKVAQKTLNIDTTFKFSGLDDGQYRLTETKTPDGYNSIEPIYFVVVAKHDDFTQKLTGLTVNKTNDKWENLEENVENKSFTVNMAAQENNISTNVVNESGSILPSTGGIGTTIFYVVGAILVIGAGIILVARKRMSHEQ